MKQPGEPAPRSRPLPRRRDRGQGLIEYSLLVAFVALAAVALMSSAGNSTSAVWNSANTQLDHAKDSLTVTGHKDDH
jgi:Flp pilus assembly pilin Flp